MSQTACSIMNVCSWAQADSFNKKNPRSKVSWQRLFPIKVQTENHLYSMLHTNIEKVKKMTAHKVGGPLPHFVWLLQDHQLQKIDRFGLGFY